MIIWGRTQDWYTWPKAEIGWRPRGQMGSNLPMDDDSLILFVSLVIFYLYSFFINLFYFKIYYNFYKDIRPFTIDTAPGYVDLPVEVDVMVQILTVNDVNLNDETVDLNIALSMMWTDYRLAWNIEDFNEIKSIEVDPRLSLRHFETS